MRLISAHITGFGRLLDSKVNLDSKVIAVVGPNEAGKTTLLEALQFVDNNEALRASDRSRAGTVADESTVVSVRFVLDPGDREALNDLDLANLPTSMTMSRTAKGDQSYIGIEPYPEKNRTPFRLALDAFMVALGNVEWKLEEEEEEEEEEELDYEDSLEALKVHLEGLDSRLKELVASSGRITTDTDLVEELARLADRANARLDAPNVGESLRAASSWLEIPDPAPAARDRLWKRTPDFLFFGDDERSLSSSYNLTTEVAASPPAALANLAMLAQLDLGELTRAIVTSDLGRRSTLLLSANRVLEEAFARNWNQSILTVILEMDGGVLNILIKENGETVTIFDERSAGLRLFVALLAFVASSNSTRPPILLVDEAETHLHFDAQADLVNTFMSQEAAAKIIYTTHSPACLPPDLGTGVRAVVPDPARPQVSQIHNSLWHHSAGFSPLLMAMGAGAAAFSTARYVVLAEGTSEMILLPSLIRAATGLASLPYQVAPGLSEAPTRLYPDLDLEAARVAYLVDGDAGGRSLRKGLEKNGVPSSLIISLGAVTLENLLDPTVYRGSVHKLLVEINGANALQPPDLDDESDPWPTVLSKWAKSKKLSMPSKVAVATRIVEDRIVGVSDDGRETLNHLHIELMHAFRLP